MKIEDKDPTKKLSDYMEEWGENAQFEIADIANESRKTMKLHSTFLGYFSNERLKLKKMDIERENLIFVKTEWILGRLTKEELDERGWEMWIGPKILRPDLEKTVAQDKDVIRKNLQYALQKEKVEFLGTVLDQIKQRGYLIKSALDWQRFTSGS